MKQQVAKQDRKNIIPVEITYSKLDENIEIASNKKHKKDVSIFLNQLFNLYDFGKNANKVINPELDYVVKFTPELIKKMQEHDIRFLEDKLTGELLPDLYDYTDKHIGGKVRLIKKGNPTAQDYANLNNSLNNMIEQQRYESLIHEIRQLHLVVKKIERGQDIDRFAKVNAGRKHLLDALNYEGDIEEKRKLIMDALSLLRQGREAIEITLVDKLNEIEAVPEKAFNRLWKCFSVDGYYDKQITRYEEIQEYFQYYYWAMQPMAYAYTCLNQPQLIEDMLNDSRKVFEHQNVGLLTTMEYLHPDREYGDDMWYKNPHRHQQRLIEGYKEKENIYITVSGQEILEAIDYEEE